MEAEEEKILISSLDLESLSSIIEKTSKDIEESEGKVLDKLTWIIRGLGSHKPTKRSGYAIVLSVLLEKFKDKIAEEDAVNLLKTFQFAKKNKKSAQRTAALAKIVAITIFIRSKVITSDQGVMYGAVEIATIGQNRQPLQAFVNSSLATVTIETNFRFFEGIISSIPASLDAFIYWFKVSPYIPAEMMELVPQQLQNSMFSQSASEMIHHQLHNTKQPWNSPLWKQILNLGTDDQLLTFWPSIVYKEMRGGNEKVKFSTIQIVKSVLPTLRKSLYPIVVCATFVKMINNLLEKPMLSTPAQEFLDFVATMDDSKLEDTLKAFCYVDAHLPFGFEFHQKLYDKCTIQQLKAELESTKSATDAQKTEYLQRIPRGHANDSGFSTFLFDKCRAILIATALHDDFNFTREVFEYIQKKWEKQSSVLAADLVVYDGRRKEGAATLPQILGEECSHFEACYRLYSKLTGASSSPSSETLIVPEIDATKPSTDHILLATQAANEPSLIQHAFKSYLRQIAPQIPSSQLREFLDAYVPAADTFSSATVEILKVVADCAAEPWNIVAPFFGLFCRTITNCDSLVAKSVGELIEAMIKRPAHDFSLRHLLKGVFGAIATIPNRIITQHDNLITPLFSSIVGAAVKAQQPLTPSNLNALEQQLEPALADFVLKSSPHFSEEVFRNIAQLPDTAPQALFGPLMKLTPQAKRLHRRMTLMGLVSTILEKPKGLEALTSRGREFNSCVCALLGETHARTKEDEKKQIKSLAAVNRWLQHIERRRFACEVVAVSDMRRRINMIMSTQHGPAVELARQIGTELQKVEQQVHVKQRNAH